jgi:uncharacterized protein YkwD
LTSRSIELNWQQITYFRKAGYKVSRSRLTKTLFASFVTISLVTTALGGAFATGALAATPDNEAIQTTTGDTSADKTIVGGLVALGLISMMAKHGGNNDSVGAADKSSTPVSTSTGSTVTKPNPSPAAASGLTADEQKAFSLLNADRAANGLSPLRINAKLTSLAGYYAQDMINRHFFAHNNPEGQTPFDRMNARGITYGYAGENLAINTSVPSAENAFMNSPGHRANILNSHYTQVGIGVRYSANGTVYVVQEFTDG